jgi:mannose-6-phosphate isomerase
VPGIALPPGEAIGETWEIYDRPEGSSRVRGAETTLADLLREHPVELLGRGVARGHGGRFPLLLKFLDAHEALSVQVHPDDEQAKHEGSGKDEACIVLHAGPEARIIRGVRPGVDAAHFRAEAHTAAVEAMLLAFVPRVGDTIHVPPGTVHAIGPDVVAFEVQQNSDVTYRLWDWGRARAVQVEQALAVTRFDETALPAEARPVVAPRPLPDGGTELVATPCFCVRRYDLRRPFTLATNRAFAAVTVIAGRGMLGWRSGGADAPLPLVAGDTALVPACVDQAFLSPIGRLELLVSAPGEG